MGDHPDRSQLLEPQATTTFSSTAATPGQTITVDSDQTFQTVDRFGASITDSSAHLLYDLPAAQRDEVMRSVFDPEEGIGMSILRQPIGASDFVEGPHYTYNDLPAGRPTTTSRASASPTTKPRSSRWCSRRWRSTPISRCSRRRGGSPRG
ncbi:hypothetical protein [Paraoerskovia sediminicola]|uniref:hypothetical protein n=1 Tax=Paraoerskovia sediminicola TaxID=1138587 RepID=UPI002573CF1A|nr:hypothetical protein [Paraoerskovia sediminicola]